MATHASAAWAALPPGAARCLEMAHRSLIADGLAVGSAIVDESGAVVAEGRNRAYDAPTNTDPLERTPLAHAEMNAIARLDTDAPTDGSRCGRRSNPVRFVRRPSTSSACRP